MTALQRVDPGVLTALLDGEYAALRARVRAFLVEHASFLADAEEWGRDEYRDRVRDMVVAAAGERLTASGFPAAYGGGDDFGGNVAAFETLAFGDLSVLVKFGVQFGLFGGAIHQLGTTPHHEAWLADIASGRLLGSFAMTETGHGSNVQAIRTTATYDAAAGEFVIETPDDDARKDYIGNAARHAQAAAVFAQLVVAGENHGVHALFVPLRDSSGDPLPGVRIEDCGKKLGLQGVDNGRIWFSPDGTVRVPRTNLLNRYGDVGEDGTYSSPIESPDRRFFTMLGTLVQGRVCVGGAGISASKTALTIATTYADRRRQFGAAGRPETVLLDYGEHQRRLLPLVARTYGLHFAQERLARDFDHVFSASDASEEGERRRRALESRAAATKALATWHATHAIQECREACGGAGYLAVNRFAALKADTDVFTTFEGDNTILLQLVGKGRLTDLRDEFGALDGVEVARYFGRQAMETLAEKTIARSIIERFRDAARGHDEGEPGGELLDHDYQLQMLRTREEREVASVARRLRGGMEDGADPAEVFSRCQHHLLAAARAHGERIVFEAFLTRVSAMPDGPEKELLSQLASLHALAEIERDRAWWLEHGRLSTERAKAVTRTVDTLCRELRPHAVDLVHGFGIPDELLTQEI